MVCIIDNISVWGKAIFISALKLLGKKRNVKNLAKRKILIACGGTGGHLTPGVAWACRLKQAGYEPVLVVSQKKIDAQMMKHYPQFEWVQIPGVYLSFSPKKFIYWLVQQGRAQWAVYRLVKQMRPIAVYGFGGFITLTVGLGAIWRRIPLFLHTADRTVGRAIRLLGRFARGIYLPEGVRLLGVPINRQASAGYPLRPQMVVKDRCEARHILGLPEYGRLLVVLGGSQGASSLNQWARDHFERLAALGYHVFVATGLQSFEHANHLQVAGAHDQMMHAYFVPFCNTMAEVLSAADIAIARGGAGTLAELEAFGVPALIIPYPYAKDDHQNANAEHFMHKGFGQKIEDNCLGQLMPLLAELTANQIPWSKWKKTLQNARQQDPLAVMMHDLEQLCADNRLDAKQP